jgi:hypothetical protein
VGLELAESVTKKTASNKYERDQRYEIFINKMAELKNHEQRFNRKKNAAYKHMKMALIN